MLTDLSGWRLLERFETFTHPKYGPGRMFIFAGGLAQLYSDDETLCVRDPQKGDHY